MSVLIKGMKKPDNCEVCPYAFCHLDTRNCPIVAIPDHGDLIDVDVFRNLTGLKFYCSECIHCGVFGCKDDITTSYICGVLDDMPVVIPAEKGDE